MLGPLSWSGGDCGDSRTGHTVAQSSTFDFLCFFDGAKHISLLKYSNPSLGVEGGTGHALLGPAVISSSKSSVVIPRLAIGIGAAFTSRSILSMISSVPVDQSESQELETSFSLSLEM